MTAAVVVGNDVVDLSRPRTEGKTSDERFVERVYDEREGAMIQEAEDPDLELWALWAAKEAGYKVISKLIGAPTPFVHRSFKVHWSDTAVPGESATGGIVRQGRVTHPGQEARVRVSRHPGCLHAVAVGGEGGLPAADAVQARLELLDEPGSSWAGAMSELERRFTERELDAVYSRQSAAVRLGAREDLARALSVDEGRLEIVCDPGPAGRRPPRVRLDGRLTGVDVSLSHDGRWIAWALWLATIPERT